MFRSTGSPFAFPRRVEVHFRFGSMLARCLMALVAVIGTAMIAIAAPVLASTRSGTVRVSSTPAPRVPAVRAGVPPTWALQTVPSPTGPDGALMAVSCSSATDCTAVGGSSTLAGKPVALVEHWNGTTWSIEATPSQAGAFGIYLSGVSCTSATACTAVGYYLTRAGMQQTLAESWNGTTWSIQTTPNANGASMLSGVSCTSAGACTAVGNSVDSTGNEMTLAEHWGGTSWSLQTTPNFPGARGSELNGVSCTSATACTAVGDTPLDYGTQRSFAEHWNGTNWSLQTTPNPTGAAGRVLSGVSCRSATLCIAVGYSTDASGTGRTLADRWNGSSWSVLTTPNRGVAPGDNLHGVSCTSASACTAVGAYVTVANPGGVPLAERWNGTSWSVQTTPQPSGIWTWFRAVSCPSATACTAVGVHLDNQRNGLTLAMRWNGTSWSVQSAPSPIGAKGSSLSAVSCTSPTECTAVGTINLPPGPPLTLAERWDGTKWSIQAMPQTGSNSYLTAVSCPSGAVCIAVGGSFNPTAAPTLAERWNGTTWSVQATPNPSGAQSSQLRAVSCTSATACTAVGDYTDSTGTQRTLAERWNGTTWSIEKTPNPAGATASGLSGVSCTATACTAVGSYTDSTGTQLTLAERWNGTAWAVQTTPEPSGATAGELSGVSCTSATACTAVGDYTNSTGIQLTLAEGWNGTTWAVQSTPNPYTVTGDVLEGVSCTSASVCTAVGVDGYGAPLAERYS